MFPCNSTMTYHQGKEDYELQKKHKDGYQMAIFREYFDTSAPKAIVVEKTCLNYS